MSNLFSLKKYLTIYFICNTLHIYMNYRTYYRATFMFTVLTGACWNVGKLATLTEKNDLILRHLAISQVLISCPLSTLTLILEEEYLTFLLEYLERNRSAQIRLVHIHLNVGCMKLFSLNMRCSFKKR